MYILLSLFSSLIKQSQPIGLQKLNKVFKMEEAFVYLLKMGRRRLGSGSHMQGNEVKLRQQTEVHHFKQAGENSSSKCCLCIKHSPPASRKQAQQGLSVYWFSTCREQHSETESFTCNPKWGSLFHCIILVL